MTTRAPRCARCGFIGAPIVEGRPLCDVCASILATPLEAITVTCLDCRASFEVTTDEQRFFERRGLSTPRRCQTCRDRRREARSLAVQPVASS